jgi:WD40 repeat protein
MNRALGCASGCLFKIGFWSILFPLALFFFIKFSAFLVLFFLYFVALFVALIFISLYFNILLHPVANSACRFLFKENIIDTKKHLEQRKLEKYNYTGLLRAYLKLMSPPRSDLKSFIDLEQRHSDAVTTLTVTSDSRWLISGSKDKTLRIWDLEERKARFIVTGHQDQINSVALTPDSRLLISSSSDKTVKVWDWDISSLTEGWDIESLTRPFQLKSESRIADDNTHLRLSLIITFLEILVSISIFVYININALLSGHQLLLLVPLLLLSVLILSVLYSGVASLINRYLRNRYNSDDVGQIIVTPDNKTAIFGSSDKTLKVWGLTNQTQPFTLGKHGDRITSVAVIDNNRVISGSYDGSLKGWNLGQPLGEHREIFTLDHSSAVTAVAVISSRDLAISGSSDGYLKVWDLRERQARLSFKGHNGMVEAIVITPDGNYLVSVSCDRSLKMWHVSADEEVTIKKITSFSADYPLTCCTVASNGAEELTVIVGDELGQICFFRVENLEFRKIS